jgi:D-alanyl-D-alanine dipeptidase
MSEDHKADVYKAIEQHFLTFQELRTVPVEENDEPMVGLRENFTGKIAVIDERMREFTGDDIYVRKTVAGLLEVAQAALREIWPDCDLEVTYGYRHLDIQTAKFQAQRKVTQEAFPELDDLELDEATHKFSAVPEVAGHPTGAAVDLRIRRMNGDLLFMGTDLGNFSSDTYTFSPYITREAWHNRQILRACMLKAGFAPFDGEWWHFSFGDREWAKYFSQEKAVYSQIRFKVS